MRITGGSLRGRVLPGKVGRGVRPTTSRVREALFSMLGQDLSGWSVLDCFGGTGLLGFEALSRGADSLTVCERHRGAARQIRASAASLGVRIELRIGDAAQVLGTGTWDLVLVDPPYDADPLPWAERAAGSTAEVLVVEQRPGVVWHAQVGPLGLVKVRRLGDSDLAIYRARAVPGPDEVAVVVDDAPVIEGEGTG